MQNGEKALFSLLVLGWTVKLPILMVELLTEFINK